MKVKFDTNIIALYTFLAAFLIFAGDIFEGILLSMNMRAMFSFVAEGNEMLKKQ